MQMAYVLKQSPTPELVIGLVAPIGVDLDDVANVLTELLTGMRYTAASLRLTRLMTEVPTGLSLSEDFYVRSYKSQIAYANEVCERLGRDALAAMAISAIRSARAALWKDQTERGSSDGLAADAIPEETPVPSQAYIIRQLKRPEEVQLVA